MVTGTDPNSRCRRTMPRRQVGNDSEILAPIRPAAISTDFGPLMRTIPRSPPPEAVAMAAIVSSRSKAMPTVYRRCLGRFEPGLLDPLGLAGLGNSLATRPPPPSAPRAPLPSPPATLGFGLGSSLRSAMPHRLEVMK